MGKQQGGPKIPDYPEVHSGHVHTTHVDLDSYTTTNSYSQHGQRKATWGSALLLNLGSCYTRIGSVTTPMPGYNPRHQMRTFGADTQVSEFYTTSQVTVAEFEKQWSDTKIRDVGPGRPNFDARLCHLLAVALRNAFAFLRPTFLT